MSQRSLAAVERTRAISQHMHASSQAGTSKPQGDGDEVRSDSQSVLLASLFDILLHPATRIVRDTRTGPKVYSEPTQEAQRA